MIRQSDRLKIQTCLKGGAVKKDKKHLKQLERILHAAVQDGCDPARLLAELAAAHLLSDETDPAHINGLTFVECMDKCMLINHVH